VSIFTLCAFEQDVQWILMEAIYVLSHLTHDPRKESEFLATDPEVPGSIPVPTRYF
jgi:hypothetical protein